MVAVGVMPVAIDSQLIPGVDLELYKYQSE